MSAAWVSAACALCVAVAGLLAWGGRLAFRLIKRTMHFLDDYMGEPARPGVPERPGVMSRLAALTEDVASIKGQVFPNGGSSLRDTVDHVATDLKAHREMTSPAIRQLGADVTQLTGDVSDMRGRLELFEHQRSEREDA